MYPMVRTEALLTWEAASPAEPGAHLEDEAAPTFILDPVGDHIFLHLALWFLMF